MSAEIDPSRSDANVALLEAIRPKTEELIHRHYENARDWYPHEYIPYDLARTFPKDYIWTPEESGLSIGERSALHINLITEDGLVHYFHTIKSLADEDPTHPLNEWANRWAAEEARHAIAIRDWIIATRAIDPRALEVGRMKNTAGGKTPTFAEIARMLVYTTLQELATRVAHSNTGARLDHQRRGRLVMARVAGDENLHHIFYRDLSKEALLLSPDAMLAAIDFVIRNFDMPGKDIPGFDDHTKNITHAGIYDLTKFKEDVVEETFKTWKLQDLPGLTANGEHSRDSIYKYLKILGRKALWQQAEVQRAKKLQEIS